MITLEGVKFAYGERAVLRGLDLTVPAGLVTVLLGPSGSGKSTILRLIAGLDVPERGCIAIDDQIVTSGVRILEPPESRGVSMVFQDLALWPHMTVGQTLAFVVGPHATRQERRQRIEATLTAVGLDGRRDARPAELSGGERQRLALARALIPRPRILLMDEPLASLDPPLRLAMMDEIRTLRRRFDVTILYVTHNELETFGLGDHAAVLHEGRIEQVGSPREVYTRPRSAFVASLLGRCALLPGTFRDGHVETTLGPMAARGVGGENGNVSVVIRPEDVRVDGNGPFVGHIESASSVGAGFEIVLTGPGWRLWALTPDPPVPGASIRFGVDKSVAVPRST